jgi:uncharacterized protein
LNIPMPVELMQANPLVEEAKGQVAVKRGPIVYCLESDELPANTSINEVLLDVKSKFTTDYIKIDNRDLLSINASSTINTDSSWDKKLYQPLSKEEAKTYSIKLIPYFAWGNKGKGEMSVWLAH